MIESICDCGAPIAAPESSVGQSIACACGRKLHVVCAEALAEGSGGGDFDAKLIVTAGPQRVGEQLLLGGVQEITLGKLPDRNIVLAGATRVSRAHAKLARVDFGPSRWEIHDNNSTNGVLVNGQRILNHELKSGDKIQIGEYELRFVSALDQVVAAARENDRKKHKGPICPSCDALLPAGAKICTNCGVDLKTGRSLVVSKGLDENDLAIRADTWIRTLSWIIPFGLFPIASEAFGTKKPVSTWVIFGITCAASVIFLVAAFSGGEEPSPTVLNMMQWNGDFQQRQTQLAAMKQIQEKIKKDLEQRMAGGSRGAQGKPAMTQQELDQVMAAMEDEDSSSLASKASFHWYQLFTSATLHEPVLIMPFFMHLGGNMLFLLVFGLRVNELIGNLKMAIFYVALAAISGLSHHFATMHASVHPSLGASGAVMGLAGMYFIFFPVQRVHMAIWFRGGWLTRWQCFYKVFTMRGFWLLVLWIGLQDVLPMFVGSRDGVAHWAHFGGFVGGIVIAIILLLSRQASAMGNDLISVALGKRAWALVGKPASQLASVAS